MWTLFIYNVLCDFNVAHFVLMFICLSYDDLWHANLVPCFDFVVSPRDTDKCNRPCDTKVQKDRSYHKKDREKSIT